MVVAQTAERTSRGLDGTVNAHLVGGTNDLGAVLTVGSERAKRRNMVQQLFVALPCDFLGREGIARVRAGATGWTGHRLSQTSFDAQIVSGARLWLWLRGVARTHFAQRTGHRSGIPSSAVVTAGESHEAEEHIA
jgi:hypothetical protein